MSLRRKKPEELRSHRWLGVESLRSFGHHSRLAQIGYDRKDYAGKPVIGILNTWSDINPCHTHFRQRVEEVKRGVWQAGGFPLELPVISLSENFQKPTTMLYRNLLAIETEEVLRSYPVDGSVLMGGCDKTTPGLVMGATSMNLPCIYFPAGPMLRGNWHGKVLGSGSDAWKYWDELKAGNIDECAWREIEHGIARSAGTCMTMGTASTMTAIADTLGLCLPGSSSIPAVDANHSRMATDVGRRAVEVVWEDLKPKDILTRAAFDNATTALMALGGSSNAVVHLLAMAGRAGVELDLKTLDSFSRRTPFLCNLRPSGKYLMEDFYYAGGLLALLAGLKDRLNLDARNVGGGTLGEALSGATVYNDDVIRTPQTALSAEGGLAVLHGNLAPDGAVIKTSALDERLLVHSGPALVFDNYDDLAAAIDNENLDVTPQHVLVLRNAGPLGGPGFPEWGMLPIPKKLLKQGVRDMVRLSDARMSGTSYGTCVLHVAPEAYIGGPLALIRTGDTIELNVPQRIINVKLSDAELAERKKSWKAPAPRFLRGYGVMFSRHITQANKGCDFDFLQGTAPIPEPEIH
ncbi:MAG TPA: L-arabinonate dehydratase [Polyangiaceae bacterium]|nr:L-arabinonate dehydratase [Polyangiaceae bacterium]